MICYNNQIVKGWKSMLNGINKLLTGDMLKVLCDMGHGDELVIADANFPAETIAKRLIRCPGANSTELLKAIKDIYPMDVHYVDYPVQVMEVTDSDKAKGMETPVAWTEYVEVLSEDYPGLELGKIERFEFYDRAKNAYAVIQTGEERQYGNLLLTKGVVL